MVKLACIVILHSMQQFFFHAKICRFLFKCLFPVFFRYMLMKANFCSSVTLMCFSVVHLLHSNIVEKRKFAMLLKPSHCLTKILIQMRLSNFSKKLMLQVRPLILCLSVNFHALIFGLAEDSFCLRKNQRVQNPI